MKICFSGFDLPEGKVKYQDDKVITLEQKCQAQKVTPFYVEFLKNDFAHGDGIVIARDRLLDLVILDLEKLENRRERTSDAQEKELLDKCLDYLEKEIPLCDVDFTDDELACLRSLAPASLKPTVIEERQPQVNDIIKKVLRKSDIVFFYTADRKEVRSWPVRKDSDIVTCAGKIHSDLARGFIKADVVNYQDFIQVHNMREARSRGLVRLVDRDYAIREGDIIEIRFNI
jgi:hypothetical protein